MNSVISDEIIAALKLIDTPTVCNAIERIKGKPFVADYLGMDIHCMIPQLGIMVGFAITATVDSTTPDVEANPEIWLNCLQMIEDSPKPAVLVFKDIGSQVRKSAHLGEVMGTVSQRVGSVGVVTDGGIRDLPELTRLGYHCFARGLTPSHGNPRIIQVGIPVVIDGILINPGDLLHGDANGVTNIPLHLANQVPEAAEQVHNDEARLLDYIKSEVFCLSEFKMHH